MLPMVAGVLWVASLASAAVAAEQTGPNSRAEATKIVAEMRRIVTPEGVERLETVHIGGIDQWIAVRGLDRRNPILLFIHGGPAFPAMPTSWFYQRGWEEYFTVVQWDQRGAGKTYASNDPAKVGPTMSPERMIADAEELIAWLRKEFGKEKILMLGHSWGSFIGLQVAQRHPDWLHAYIAMAQITHARQSERLGWRFAMDRAHRASNETAVRELQAIAGYADEDGKPLLYENIMVQRRWLVFYGGGTRGRERYDHELVGTALAPEYTDADIKLVWVANEFSQSYLLPAVLSADFSTVTALQCPLIMFSGRDDYTVSAILAEQWFERVKAPSKAFVWFERSAHEVMNEEPGKLLLSLVQHARPIAERAGDAAPKH